MYKSGYSSILFYLYLYWEGTEIKDYFYVSFLKKTHLIKYATVFQFQPRGEKLLKGNELSSSLKSLIQFVYQVKPVLTVKSLFLYFKGDSNLVKGARLTVQKGEVVCLFTEEILLIK